MTSAEATPLSDPAAPADGPAPADPWHDLDAYVALPRLGGLLLSGDGATLLASVATLDHERTGYRSAWWRIDPNGVEAPRRLTRSVEGESFGALLPDGGLLFGSRRPAPPAPADADEVGSSDEVASLWLLPPGGGEAYVVARRSGGWSGVHAAAGSRTVVALAPTHRGVADDTADARKRAERSKRKVSAILHEASPVRHWDHDLGPVADRLQRIDLRLEAADVTASITPLAGDLGRALDNAALTLDADGARLAVDFAEPRRGGGTRGTVALVDTTTGDLQRILSAPEVEFGAPVLSADGRWLACVRGEDGTGEQAPHSQLWLVDLAAAQDAAPDDENRTPGRVLCPDWDRWATPVAFSPDARTLYVVADEDGACPVFAISLDDDRVRRLTGDGAFSSVLAAPDGTRLYALRASYLDPGSIVSIDTATGEVRELPSPAHYPALPGRMERVETTAADGTRVPGWLLLPTASDPDVAPAAGGEVPLALWIHGGPLNSWNSWSWRWCPWLLVRRGWAVLLPDPALSTGYGRDVIQRGWGRWGAEPFTDLMALTDAVEQRPDIDASRTVAMGGSFGGYMANWVAGHTDRFRAIVTHASLWNLESFGATTDAPWYWDREMTPEMRRANSPHRFADQIVTPMLVVHGDHDYRVPIGEGLALWWALVAGWQGEPDAMPHKFLYFPDENHWVLSPQHAIVWYDTVLRFIEAGIGGPAFERPDIL